VSSAHCARNNSFGSPGELVADARIDLRQHLEIGSGQRFGISRTRSSAGSSSITSARSGAGMR
jgi:hypothetical protein